MVTHTHTQFLRLELVIELNKNVLKIEVCVQEVLFKREKNLNISVIQIFSVQIDK